MKYLVEFTFRFIHSHNRKHLPYTLASNHMADMTNEEMGIMRGRLRSSGYNGGLPFAYTTGELKSVPKSLGKLYILPTKTLAEQRKYYPDSFKRFYCFLETYSKPNLDSSFGSKPIRDRVCVGVKSNFPTRTVPL